jgi:hypothetical protein
VKRLFLVGITADVISMAMLVASVSVEGEGVGFAMPPGDGLPRRGLRRDAAPFGAGALENAISLAVMFAAVAVLAAAIALMATRVVAAERCARPA